MRTKIQTVANIKNILLEIFFNKTNKVTKVSDHSVVNGIFYSLSKLLQKGMKDSAIVESEQFPESGYGQDLDVTAKRQGLKGRYASLHASTYVRVVGEYGTQYVAEENIFITSGGAQFKASSDWEIPQEGYTYVKVTSLLRGSSMNIDPNSINKVLAPPAGHLYCTNEVSGTGGREVEPDDIFRSRIQEGFNILATETLGKLTQAMIQINPAILQVKKVGRTSQGLVQLGILTQTGQDLTQGELEVLLVSLTNYVSLADMRFIGGRFTGIELVNIPYFYIDMDFRVDLFQETSLLDFISSCQIQISKSLDWRYWEDGEKVQWDDLFFIVRSQKGVRFLPDQYFTPASDMTPPSFSVPRLRGFIVRSLSGEVLVDTQGSVKPVFYKNYLDTNFAAAVLSNI